MTRLPQALLRQAVLSAVMLSVCLGSCPERTTCGSCMEDPACSWCADPPPRLNPRCMERGTEEAGECGAVVDLASSVQVTRDEPLSLDSPTMKFMQIQPQAADVVLRPGRPMNISFVVGHAKNFPVDLYFLMDLSWSMRSSRDKLISVSGDIIDAIKRKTDDVNIGFGSFVEKNVPPFTSPIQGFNCAKENPHCAPPYSFFHQQQLGNITANQFSKAVEEAPLAGNIDDPEGSLDALMQVMVCESRVGWRDTSRRMIILLTDRDFHFAMDGKLAGILKPNDGRCHLHDTGNGSGYYTMGESQDYPSISHINSVVQANSFILLFGVIKSYINIYQALVDRIPGSSADILSEDGSNIVQLVENKYEDISTSIRMTAGTAGTELGVRFFSSCGRMGPPEEVSVCSNVQIGTQVEFVAELTLEACSPGVDKIPVFPIGLNESLDLSVSSNCHCPCEDESSMLGSALCSGQGSLVCGECRCNPGHYGRQCECDGESENIVGEELCRAETSAPVCSERGVCTCGLCTCHPNKLGTVNGTYCECDDWTCPRDKAGVLCSGHGACVCGKCECAASWVGEACGCTDSTAPCMSPYDGEVCSGNGECKCGRCVCRAVDSGSALFTGLHCEQNPLEPGIACSELKDCVECQQFPVDGEDCSHCLFQSKQIERSEFREVYPDLPVCERFRGNCRFYFASVKDSQGGLDVYLVLVEGEKEVCDNIGLQLGIGAGLLVFLIGLVTIVIYKCCIVINDRRQYANFLREVDQTKNAVNTMPNDIYKSPITKFENPTYGQG